MKAKIASFKVLIFIVFPLFVACSRQGIIKVTIVETTDVHGVILPYDFIDRTRFNASLAGVATYLKKVRQEKNPVILLDDGDNLQGQPEEYYYNFIDTVSPHFNGEVMNRLFYDAGTIGNHDIEAGHSVYDRIRRGYKFPLLAANAVVIKTGEPYFEPYIIIKKSGLKIAVFGLITSDIPTWLPPELYSGIEFRDMVETARHWMPKILNEKPDLVIGLFHEGWNKSYADGNLNEFPDENGSAGVAFNVPGFDVIFIGHDHNTMTRKFLNSKGDTILILDGGSNAEKIARADIILSKRRTGGRRALKTVGSIVSVKDFPPDRDFMNLFSKQYDIINRYVNKVIGQSTSSISSRDAYFGSSAFVDMIHSVQLEIADADVSFAAPLSYDVSIPKGGVTVGDMFKLYRYENLLYTIKMTGSEIKKYLEYSYSGWVNTMSGPDDLLIKIRVGKDGKPLLYSGKARLKNPSYNFDSAAGIDYSVDVSKPEGSRILIKSFTDGRSFVTDKSYKVAVSSFRGNGGGGHLTEGAGIDAKDLRSRFITSTEKDLRFYIMKSIENKNVIEPVLFNNWKFIPERWIKVASRHDYSLLFGHAK